VSFSVLFVCICVLYYCHRVATQLHLNISYHIIKSYPIIYHITSYISYTYHIISHQIISYHITSTQYENGVTELNACTVYNKYRLISLRHGQDRALPTLFLIFVLLYVLFVLCCSLYCLCVYVYCTTATGWLPNCI
jgi:hypothetical protein